MVGIGALLTVLTSGPAMAVVTEDGTATVTWPGYNTAFVAGSDPVPNKEPVVIEINLTKKDDDGQPFYTLTDFYFQIPGLPNPAYFEDQKNFELNVNGEYFYPGKDQLVFTLETSPAVSYDAWSAYFFDASCTTDDNFCGEERSLVGGGIFGSTAKIETLKLTLAPGSLVQMSSYATVELLQLSVTGNPSVVFEDFTMLTPALAPETTPAPKTTPAPVPEPESELTQELARTGIPTKWMASTTAVGLAVLLAGGVLAMAGKRRLKSDR
jgi:hypothetical protein